MRKWYLSVVRHGLYLLDALHLVRVVGAARRSGADVIIMDRYIYDELANLPLSNILTRIFVRMVSGFVPKPDVAYLLDADPEAARPASLSIRWISSSMPATPISASPDAGEHDYHSATSAP